MTHTKEPWHVGSQNDAIYLIAGRRPALDNDYPWHDAPRTPVAKVYSLDDAERAKDCVNALAGYDPDALADVVKALEAIAGGASDNSEKDAKRALARLRGEA